MGEAIRNWLSILWRALASNRSAAILIGLWVLLCAVGLVIPESAGIDIFHSAFVPILGTLLTISLIACTVRRASRLRRRGQGSDMSISAETAEHARVSLSEGMDPQDALEHARATLTRRRYAITADTPGSLRVQRYRASRYSSFVIHLTLIALVVTLVIAAFTGFKEPFFTVVEGQAQDLGHGTGLQVALQSFRVDYWGDGTPRSYLSTVRVSTPSGVSREGDVAVNHPLNVDGVRLFQTGFGSAPRLSIAQKGQPVAETAVPLDSAFEHQNVRWPAGMAPIAPLGLEAWVVGPTEASSALKSTQVLVELTSKDGIESLGQLILDEGASGELGDLSVTYLSNSSFSVFSVSKEPARVAIFVAAALFVLGLIGALWFPYSAVRLCAVTDETGTCYLAVTVQRPGGRARQRRADRMAEHIERSLGGLHSPPIRDGEGGRDA